MSTLQKKVPHVIVILFIMMVIAMIATWLVPAGQYTREPGPNNRQIVIPGSFQVTGNNPVGIFKLFKAVPEGMTQAGMISFTILIVGGAWAVINATGALASAVDVVVKKLKGKEIWAIPLIMILIALVSAFIGALELCIVYIPIIIPLALALGFDTLTAAAIALVASGGAFAAALTNPFTVGIAHNIAGLPLYSGIQYRIIVLISFLLVGMLYVIRYAKKVKKDPSNSLVYNYGGFESELDEESNNKLKNNGSSFQNILIGIILIAGFAGIIYGVLQLKWFMYEIGAIFFIWAVLIGLVGGLSLNELAEKFVEGCKHVVLAALVVGFARSILVIINAGGITDTIIFGLVELVKSLPEQITVVGIFISQSIFNLLVPSGSGQTLITMPILAPLSDVVGITRQTTVLATQLGDGITNILYPVSGALMASLGIAKIPFEKWLKFIIPLILTWTGMGIIFLIIAQLINWGPF